MLGGIVVSEVIELERQNTIDEFVEICRQLSLIPEDELEELYSVANKNNLHQRCHEIECYWIITGKMK